MLFFESQWWRRLFPIKGARRLKYRWGGEEYVAVIANVEGDELIRTANRRRALADAALRIAVSVGVTLARVDDTAASIIRRADQLMYKSKGSGRNRVATG